MTTFTATVQVNAPALVSTDEGYISSITVRTGGSAVAKTPDAAGQITVSQAAATALVQDYAKFKIVLGGIP